MKIGKDCNCEDSHVIVAVYRNDRRIAVAKTRGKDLFYLTENLAHTPRIIKLLYLTSRYVYIGDPNQLSEVSYQQQQNYTQGTSRQEIAGAISIIVEDQGSWLTGTPEFALAKAEGRVTYL